MYMDAIKKILGQFETYAGAFCQGLMVIMLLLQVISRYIFRNSIPWTEEIALILFVLSIYFGASAAIYRKQHLRLEVLTSKFSPKGQLAIGIVGNICFFFFNCVILTGFHRLIGRLHQTGVATAVSGIPKWTFYTVIEIMFVVMAIRLIQDSILLYREMKTVDGAGASK